VILTPLTNLILEIFPKNLYESNSLFKDATIIIYKRGDGGSLDAIPYFP
jgi:hypothetical protein